MEIVVSLRRWLMLWASVLSCLAGAAHAADLGPGTETQTNASLLTDSIWRLRPADSEEKLRAFLERYDTFRNGNFCGIAGRIHFETEMPRLYIALLEHWSDFVEATEERRQEVFTSVIRALGTVQGASSSSRQLAVNALRSFIIRNVSQQSPLREQFFSFMVTYEIGLVDGGSRFCSAFYSPDAMPAFTSLRPYALESVRHFLAAEYVRLGSEADVHLCMYRWSLTGDPMAIRDFFTIVGSGLHAGDTKWIPIVQSFLAELTDAEPIALLQQTGALAGVAFTAATQNPSSAEAATILSSHPELGRDNWLSIFTGLLNNSVTAVSDAHIQALLQIVESHPEIAAALKASAQHQFAVPGNPPAYYNALSILDSQLGN